MRDLDSNNALDGITMDINVTTDNTTKFNRHNNSSNIVPQKIWDLFVNCYWQYRIVLKN